MNCLQNSRCYVGQTEQNFSSRLVLIIEVVRIEFFVTISIHDISGVYFRSADTITSLNTLLYLDTLSTNYKS